MARVGESIDARLLRLDPQVFRSIESAGASAGAMYSSLGESFAGAIKSHAEREKEKKEKREKEEKDKAAALDYIRTMENIDAAGILKGKSEHPWAELGKRPQTKIDPATGRPQPSKESVNFYSSLRKGVTDNNLTYAQVVQMYNSMLSQEHFRETQALQMNIAEMNIKSREGISSAQITAQGSLANVDELGKRYTEKLNQLGKIIELAGKGVNVSIDSEGNPKVGVGLNAVGIANRSNQIMNAKSIDAASKMAAATDKFIDFSGMQTDLVKMDEAEGVKKYTGKLTWQEYSDNFDKLMAELKSKTVASMLADFYAGKDTKETHAAGLFGSKDYAGADPSQPDATTTIILLPYKPDWGRTPYPVGGGQMQAGDYRTQQNVTPIGGIYHAGYYIKLKKELWPPEPKE